MRLALCGLPAAGKSTLFAALAGRRAPAVGGRQETGLALLDVPDERVERLTELYQPQKSTHAQISFLDPPGPPAKAEDPAARLPVELGQVEGLVQVVRNFDAGLGAPEPAAEFRAFVEEMLLHDLITVERRLERLAADRQRGRGADGEEVVLLERAQGLLGQERLLAQEPELAGHVKMRGFGLLTAKPRVVVANNAEDDPTPPELGGPMPVVVRAAIEAELAELEPVERAEFMAELGLSESALDRLITAAYQACRLISFFTVGGDEVRAWSVAQGTPAVQAAGVIHTDLEKGFIRAEVIRFDDLMEQGSEAAAKKAGLMKLVGKDYPLADGDVFHVRFNV